MCSLYVLDGIPTVPEGQAGAEVFDCPDDYIVVDGIRLCGYKLNDASTIFDYTKNAIVSGDLTTHTSHSLQRGYLELGVTFDRGCFEGEKG